jgi:hypothetical protein
MKLLVYIHFYVEMSKVRIKGKYTLDRLEIMNIIMNDFYHQGVCIFMICFSSEIYPITAPILTVAG